MKPIRKMLLPAAVFLISLLGYSQPVDPPADDTLHPKEIPVDIPEKQGDSILKSKASLKDAPKIFNSDDARYLQEAYSVGLIELKLAEQAKTKSQSAEVKEFAGLMIAAHAKLNDQIQSMSSKKQVPLPSLSKEQQEKLKNLFETTEKEYDREFIDLMIAEHKAAVDLFEKAAKHSSDPEVKDLFNNALPELVKHTGMAVAIKEKAK